MDDLLQLGMAGIEVLLEKQKSIISQVG
jgi:hypothetical protein